MRAGPGEFCTVAPAALCPGEAWRRAGNHHLPPPTSLTKPLFSHENAQIPRPYPHCHHGGGGRGYPHLVLRRQAAAAQAIRVSGGLNHRPAPSRPFAGPGARAFASLCRGRPAPHRLLFFQAQPYPLAHVRCCQPWSARPAPAPLPRRGPAGPGRNPGRPGNRARSRCRHGGRRLGVCPRARRRPGRCACRCPRSRRYCCRCPAARPGPVISTRFSPRRHD